MAEDKGFEPLRRFLDLLVFKTSPFNRTWVILRMVTRTGFEPVNACVKGMCVNRFTNGPFSFMAPEIGLEPTTQRLTAVCSTN